MAQKEPKCFENYNILGYTRKFQHKYLVKMLFLCLLFLIQQ